MSDDLALVRDRLQMLDRAVAAGVVNEDRRLWGGAGLGVVEKPSENLDDPSAKYVITPHATVLSWLVRALWTACRPILDHETKIEFFGRLGNAAHRYQRRAGDNESARDLLGAVLHEAYVIVDDVESGRFQTLLVAPPSVVYDDFLPESAHDDALSDGELEQWFANGGANEHP